MDDLVYDHDKLKAAVTLLLDQKYGKTRTDVVRSNLTGATKTLKWFWGPRLPLKYFLEIAKQPGGRLWALDMLDMADRNRETVAKEREAQESSTAKNLRVLSRESARRLRIRESAAILTERIRRVARNEPPLSTQGEADFLKRRREYWDRRISEYLEAAKYAPEMKHIGTLRAEIADILFKEELSKYEQAKAGIYNLSSSSQRRLNSNPRDKKMRERVETAMAAAFKASQQ